MEDSDNTSGTATVTVRTIWSETMLEMLYELLQNNKPDEAIREVLKELKIKGMKPNDILRKVAQNVDEQATVRLMGLLMKKHG